MPKYIISGKRGDSEFQAPVEAEDAQDAEVTFMEDVTNPEEFAVRGIEPRLK